MTRERRARVHTSALDDVEHAGRKACFVGDVGEQRRRERRPLRRLEDDAVTRGERRADAPRGQHEGRVPRRDDGDDTRGVVRDALAVAAPGDLHVGVLEILLEVVREKAEVHRHTRHDATQVAAKQRAVVTRLDLAQLLDAGLDALGNLAQDGGALGGARLRPGGERLASCGDRGVDLGLTGGTDLTDDRLVDRRDGGERGAVGARDALAADPVPGVDLDTLDGDLLRVRHDAPRRSRGW